jgi:O-acetyl-ADP-ribose deacetylase (regulator of RNase III)
VISYVRGDATRPIESPGPRCVVHVCNDVGGWGAGFVLAVSARWAAPEAVYRAEERRTLGSVQLVEVEPRLYVANLIAQNGFPSRRNDCALDFAALGQCLRTLAEITSRDWSYHMPRIGCGIAGGRWAQVEPVVAAILGDRPVVVYDLPGAQAPQ